MASTRLKTFRFLCTLARDRFAIDGESTYQRTDQDETRKSLKLDTKGAETTRSSIKGSARMKAEENGQCGLLSFVLRHRRGAQSWIRARLTP